MINETISHDILVVRSRALEAQVINHQITQIRQAASLQSVILTQMSVRFIFFFVAGWLPVQGAPVNSAGNMGFCCCPYSLFKEQHATSFDNRKPLYQTGAIQRVICLLHNTKVSQADGQLKEMDHKCLKKTKI